MRPRRTSPVWVRQSSTGIRIRMAYVKEPRIGALRLGGPRPRRGSNGNQTFRKDRATMSSARLPMDGSIRDRVGEVATYKKVTYLMTRTESVPLPPQGSSGTRVFGVGQEAPVNTSLFVSLRGEDPRGLRVARTPAGLGSRRVVDLLWRVPAGLQRLLRRLPRSPYWKRARK